jgi:hypothetical protein
VGRDAPSKFATDDETNPVPFTVRVCCVEPTDAALGETEVIAGAGFSTANTSGFEAPPPGAGLVTTTLKFPAVDNSALVRAIVS